MDPQLLAQLMQLLQQQQGGMGGGMAATQDPISALLTLLNTPFAMNALRSPYQMQMQMAKTAMDPSAMMARYGQFYRPLSKQLINEVTAGVGPSIAERGMGTSPGQIARMEGGALAPYEMQNQQQAMSAAMGSMQMPFNIGSGVAGEYPASLAGMGTSTGGALNELLSYLSGQGGQGNQEMMFDPNSLPSVQAGGQGQNPSLMFGPSSGGFQFQ